MSFGEICFLVLATVTGIGLAFALSEWQGRAQEKYQRDCEASMDEIRNIVIAKLEAHKRKALEKKWLE